MTSIVELTMRFKHFDLNLLQTLDVLLETKSVTIASERLHIGQSATSSALGRLRDYFDDQLLVREGKKMQLTPLAYSLQVPVKEAMKQVTKVLEPEAEFDPVSSSVQFTIACSDYISNTVVAKLSRELNLSNSNIQINVVPIDDFVTNKLARRDIDLIIASEMMLDSTMPRSNLVTAECVCVSWNKNQYIRDVLTPELFHELGHLVVKSGLNANKKWEDRITRGDEFNRRIEVTVNSFSNVFDYIVGSNLITMMHGFYARHMATYWPINVYPCPIKVPPITIFMQHNYLDNDNPANFWLRNKLTDLANHFTN